MTDRPASGRIPALDGLRGVAALVVVVHHGLLVFPAFADPYFGRRGPASAEWLTYSPLHIVWAGGEAVVVFFVLSGVVLTMPVLRPARYDWRAYYPSRLLRLYLPVFGAVVFAVLVVLAVPRVARPGQSEWVAAHTEPFNPWLDSFLLKGTDALNSPLWSLRWEVLFSLLLPVYVMAARASTRRMVWMVGGLVAIAVVGTAGSVMTARLFSPVGATVAGAAAYLPVFLIGCLIAANAGRLRGWFERHFASPAAGWLLIAAALVAITSRWWVGLVVETDAVFLTFPLIAAGAAALVLLAMSWRPLAGLLQTRPLQWLGRISFSLYLTHEPLIVSVGQLLPRGVLWLEPVIAVPVALVVAWLFFRMVEAPSHRLSQAVRGRLKVAPSGATASAS